MTLCVSLLSLHTPPAQPNEMKLGLKIPRDTRAKTGRYLLVALTPLSLIYAVGTLIFTLEPLSTLGVSFFLFLVYIFIADNISISMYIMCVILCFIQRFESQGRRVTNFRYYNNNYYYY